MLMESKDDIKRRGGKSPDYADALVYATLPFDAALPGAELNAGDVVDVDAMSAIEDELVLGLYAISPV
jgi:hypothetical protein